MRNGDDMTDRDRKQQATAPSRSRSVVRAMIWATVPVLLVVELIAEPLWKMRYDQVTSVLNEIMHDETIAAAAVYDDTGVAIARVVARPADQAVSEVSRPIRYSNGNIAVQAGRIAIAYSYATVYTDTGSRLLLLLVVGLLATFATLIAMRISANIFIGKPLTAIMSAI